jgi:hypothetical protein
VQRSQSRTPKPGTKDGAAQRAPAGASTISASAQRTPQFAQRQDKTPAIPLRDGAAQKKVAVGEAGDPYEREADAVSNKVKNGQAVQASSISSLSPGAISRMANDQKKPEVGSGGDQKPVQKQAATAPKPEQKPDEKKPESKAVQKAATPASAQKPEEKKPESKAVQKAETPAPAQKPEEKKPESKAVQKAETSAPAQKPEEKKPESKAAQKAEAPGGSKRESSMSDVAEQAIATKGSGRAMNPDTRGTLESRMGADLGDVRVHDDAAAQGAASDLDARAFTHQNDIWLGEGESDKDVGLMAHETTHVIQQGDSAQRQAIQRKKGGGKTPAAGSDADMDYSGPEGKLSVAQHHLWIPKIKVPTFKKGFVTAPFDLPKKAEDDDERPDDQRQVWEKDARTGTGTDDKLKTKLDEDKAPKMNKNNEPFYFFTPKNAPNYYIIGNKTMVKNRSLRPVWDDTGKFMTFDVDHKLELQLGGDHDISNMWLLESTANRSSGRNIRAEKFARIQSLLMAARKKVANPLGLPTVDEARREPWTITFESVVGGLPVDGHPEKRWPIEEIRDKGGQIDKLRALSKKEIEKAGLSGSPDKLVIFTNEAGGGARKIPWGEGITKKKVNEPWGENFEITSITYNKGQGGSITGVAFGEKEGKAKPITAKLPPFDIQEKEGVDYGGFVPRASVTRAASSALTAKGLSPIQIEDAELSPEQGLVARGQILPSLQIFQGLQIPIIIDGNDIYISKVFSAGDFKLPGPIKVTDATLELTAGTRGIGATGEVLFKIERVGSGKIGAKASSRGGGTLALFGEFNFDPKLFDEARLKVSYEDDAFGMEGHIAIKKPDKIRGIKSASADVSYDKGKLSASGSAELSIPGIKSAAINMSYSEAEGFMVGGAFELADNIPGIKSGGGEVQIKQKKDDEGYEITAHGKAVPNIPGISSSIDIRYENGAITIEGTVGYEKGMLKGSVTIGVTNRPVDEAGQPGDGPGGKELKIYGGGSVTIKIAPWLQGTIGIMFLPNGEIVVTGEVGLPGSIDLFPEKKFDKNLFTIKIDIPIVGVSVLGHNIGIFASIGGGLDLSAGIGPIQLQELGLSVTYNPAHEEQTTVTGRGKLHIPAHAGLRLFVRGGLGVGIPIVSAEAGLEIGAALGLEGALDAGVEVNWSPMQGLKIDAFGEVYVEPKLKFDVTGFVEVEADLLFKTITLYEKKWQLASFEFGSGLRFGVKFPIHYEEGKPFNVSLDDLEFQVPDIDPMDLLSNLIDQI